MVVNKLSFIDWAVINQSDITGKLKTRLSLEVGYKPNLNTFPFEDLHGSEITAESAHSVKSRGLSLNN